MTGINDFAQLTGQIETRVEEVVIEGVKDALYVREMNGSTTMELMKRSPNTIKETDGSIVTDNSTNRLDMAFVLARCVVRADDHTKILEKVEKRWQELPNRVLQPLFVKILEISELGGDDEETEGNDEDGS